MERRRHQLRGRPEGDDAIRIRRCSARRASPPGPTNTLDIANYQLSSWNPASVGESAQLNLQGVRVVRADLPRREQRLGTLEFGGKIRNGDKYNNSYTTTYTAVKGARFPSHSSPEASPTRTSTTTRYPCPSQNVDFTQVQSYVRRIRNNSWSPVGPGPNKSQFDLTERVGAGYVMNTRRSRPRARDWWRACASSRHMSRR